MACCSKARSVLPKLQVFGDQEHTDALLLFANILDIHIENQPQTFLQTCRRLADLHHKDPRSVEMLIPQLCGACVKLAAPAMHVLQSSFFVKRSAASLHFALLCSLSLLGMVQEPPLPRRASQSQELSAFSGTADATVQQRLMQLLHAICCASIARSKGMEERDGGLMLRDDRHFMSEARFAALVLAKGSSNGYGGLNFLDSVRQELQRSIDRARHDGGGGVEGGGSEMVAVGAWSAPAWMNKAMLQRLRVMCDTLWLLSQCVGFSEELRGVEDRPSRRARLSTLLQVPQRTHTPSSSAHTQPSSPPPRAARQRPAAAAHSLRPHRLQRRSIRNRHANARGRRPRVLHQSARALPCSHRAGACSALAAAACL